MKPDSYFKESFQNRVTEIYAIRRYLELEQFPAKRENNLLFSVCQSFPIHLTLTLELICS